MLGAGDVGLPFVIGAASFSVDLTTEQSRSDDGHI